MFRPYPEEQLKMMYHDSLEAIILQLQELVVTQSGTIADLEMVEYHYQEQLKEAEEVVLYSRHLATNLWETNGKYGIPWVPADIAVGFLNAVNDYRSHYPGGE